ncbi:hypothetical protein AX16_010604 [Volvariella volvacea WC 439]|nr:hypothetical protein AX16_010604 [Volvariella volvacea WC 439]
MFHGGQDISSYGIARSLGVIDDVKASTSDKATIHHDKDTPSILIQESLTPNESIFPQTREGTLSGLDSSTGHASRDVINGSNDTDLLNVSQPDAYYASEDNNLKLSGVGVFSPAGSQPGSPTLSRRNLLGDRMLSVEALTPLQDDVLAVRRRPGAGQPGFVDE